MPTPTKSRRVTAEDLYSIELIAAADFAQTGDRVVWVVPRTDAKTQKKYSDLFVAKLDDAGAGHRFTYGDWADSSPAFSPDGRTIAFVSNRQDEKRPQIFILPVDGGEARPLTDVDGQFGELLWSPDGTNILCTFRAKDADAIAREKDEDAKKLGIVARHITRMHYKEDGEGYLPQNRWQIAVVDAASGELRALAADDSRDFGQPRWSPDGTTIVCVVNQTADPDLSPEEIDVVLIDVASGARTTLPAPVGPKGLPNFSPDGRMVAYLGHEGLARYAQHTNLWVVPSDGSAPARNISESHDIVIGGATINDLGGFTPTMPPTWASDAAKIIVQFSRHGSVILAAFDVANPTANPEIIVDGPGSVAGFWFDATQRTLVFVQRTIADPGQIFARDMRSGEQRPITRLNADYLAETEFGAVEEIWFSSGDGTTLQGWILTPPGFDAAKKYPSIMQIHGGPLTQYGHAMMHEFQFLAAQGYVVAFSNPRGGLGYGQAHAKAIDNAWGTVDYDDVMAFADEVAKRPYIDRERMGVTGGSYGGYMTNWIIGRTQRFRAAVTQRSVSNLLSMYGSSDYNWNFQETFGNRPPWETVENYWRQSPVSAIGHAKTPTLVIHSEQDLRCDREQGEQIFVALKKLGVPTEMVLFPDEAHGLSRGGRTDRRIARLGHIVRWMDRFLKAPADGSAR